MGAFSVRNRYDFKSLDHLAGQWILTRNGESINTGILDITGIKSGEEKIFRIPIEVPEYPEPGEEYFLNFSFQLKEEVSWANKGHEVATGQFRIPVENRLFPLLDVTEIPALKLSESEKSYSVSGENFEMLFDRQNGYLSSVSFLGQAIIEDPMKPNFWRPQTDNDFRGAMTHIGQGAWKKAGPGARLASMDVIRIHDGVVKIICRHFLPDVHSGLIMSYTIFGSGDILVQYTFEPGKDLPEIPRIGLQLGLNKSMQAIKWFGRGPMESYRDRNSSVPVGLYRQDVTRDYQMYIKPQESGNKTDVRWASLENTQVGLLIMAKEKINVSAWPYSMEAIENARHTVDLVPGDWITLNIDKMQMGLGGDDSWSEKAKPHEKFRIYPAHHTWSFRLSLVDLQKRPAREPVKRWLPEY
jgi:beta-galactosidase